MSDAIDQNNHSQVIQEFRANGGKLGGHFEGHSIILVHHTGRKSGVERVNPMMYQAVGDSFAVFASKRGAPSHPDWYYNLKANPYTTVEVGTEIITVRAREADGEERSRIWAAQKAAVPVFAQYETMTNRVIPVLLLERA